MPCGRRAPASSRRFPRRGIVKYAKPAGVIASLVPTTNPELTPPYTGIYALKCLDAVIFSPHPRSKRTHLRDGARDARGDQPPGRARGSVPVHRESERGAHAVPHGELRSHARHRRTAHGARRLQLRAARLRRRRRQFDHGDRRNRRHRHRRAQHAHVEDLGFRLRLLRRRQHSHRLAHLRRIRRRAGQGRRLPRQQGAGGRHRKSDVG